MNFYKKTALVLLFIWTLAAPVNGQWLYQNPYTPASPWSESHSVYSQQNSIYPGPYPGETIATDTILLSPGDIGGEYSMPILTDLYPDGETYCFWFTTGSVLGKVICTPDSISWIKADPVLFGNKPMCGRIAMDNNRNVYVLSDYKVYVLKDSIRDDPYSAVAIDKIIDLTEYKPPLLDSLWTVKILWSGDILVVSRQGKVFVIKACNLNVKTKDLDGIVYNSAVVEEDGSFYLTTQFKLVKYRWNGLFINHVWSVYTGRSGTTPTLFGITEPDKYVIIADYERPFNLILVWRDYIPTDWQGIPGYDRRIAGIQPVTFGNLFPQGNINPPENSLMLEANNILAVRYDTLYPGPTSYKPGLQKFTWNTQTRSFEESWLNQFIYMPNAMTSLSIPNSCVYGIGERFIGDSKKWTLEGVDWQTGNSSFHVVLGDHSESIYNIEANGIAIGYRGELLTMSPRSILRFRPYFTTSTASHGQKPQINIFPTLVEDFLNIRTTSVSRSHIRIFDFSGNVVQEGLTAGELTRVDCTSLPPGFYVIQAEGFSAVKFMKR